MAKRLMFEKPLGMRDTLPFFYNQKTKAREKLTSTILSYGYSLMDTPLLEYHETVGKMSATPEQQLFKLLDQQGHTLVLRPDMTAPIARVAASQLKEAEFPLRLAYEGPVFRAQQTEGGKPAQFEQVGTELIGDHSSYGDAEVIALLVESLKQAGLDDFVITIGHIGFVKSFFHDLLGKESEIIELLLQHLYRKNYVGFREDVKMSQLPEETKQALLSILRLRGGEEVFTASKALARNQSCMQAVNELKQLYKILKQYGVDRYVHVDLNLISHMNYYTGILFEGYAPKLGALLCNGGRYDTLLPSFQLNASATGFAIHLERLLEALEVQEQEDDVRVGVIVDDDTHAEGLQRAGALRHEGYYVLLQHIDQVPDLEKFKEQLHDSIDLTVRGGGLNE
ncbi:ATP phosphoribosyltransferase regulatory subunit [Halobacillus naozhouensis]|uniref:ATP phosphoribosyltransferase regulatory subunit n=1 Tax=Halobacillus naozhouensis TaxID=554880 RepID=A0ABY8IYB5_9BACI|nr:ATP phosphoribosyltransferase regulatory subunit [Halobacillus naozhouensis]WFT73736.1 ATP phosphoribosyltransferase regulatory subunit [Halobacillus naozhouensis]